MPATGEPIKRKKTVQDGVCTTVDVGFNDVISSFGPSRVGDGRYTEWGCEAFADPGCTGKRSLFFYPGSRNLDAHGMNKMITSVKCAMRVKAHSTKPRPA